MTRDEVLKLKDEMEYARNLYEASKKQLELNENRENEATYEFRIAEVDYVLDKLRYLISNDKLSKNRIDVLIVHCLNCLHGNIDGTVLDLEDK